MSINLYNATLRRFTANIIYTVPKKSAFGLHPLPTLDAKEYIAIKPNDHLTQDQIFKYWLVHPTGEPTNAQKILWNRHTANWVQCYIDETFNFHIQSDIGRFVAIHDDDPPNFGAQCASDNCCFGKFESSMLRA